MTTRQVASVGIMHAGLASLHFCHLAMSRPVAQCPYHVHPRFSHKPCAEGTVLCLSTRGHTALFNTFSLLSHNLTSTFGWVNTSPSCPSWISIYSSSRSALNPPRARSVPPREDPRPPAEREHTLPSQPLLYTATLQHTQTQRPRDIGRYQPTHRKGLRLLRRCKAGQYFPLFHCIDIRN
jgi:hypothetical protein